jgi:hypothetical protein
LSIGAQCAVIAKTILHAHFTLDQYLTKHYHPVVYQMVDAVRHITPYGKMPITYAKGLELCAIIRHNHGDPGNVFEPSADPYGFAAAFLSLYPDNAYKVSSYDANMMKISRFISMKKDYPGKFINCGLSPNIKNLSVWVKHCLKYCVLQPPLVKTIIMDLSLNNKRYIGKKQLLYNYKNGARVMPHENFYDVPFGRVDSYLPYLTAYYSLIDSLPFGTNFIFKIQDPFVLSFARYLQGLSTMFEKLLIVKLKNSNKLGREFYCCFFNRGQYLSNIFDLIKFCTWGNYVVNDHNRVMCALLQDPAYDPYKVLIPNRDLVDRTYQFSYY